MVQEFCIGTNMLSIATGGLILTVLGAMGGAAGQPPPRIPYALGLLGLVVHVAALYGGTWKIFRPQDRWPLPLVTVATTLACVWMVSALLAGTGEGLARRRRVGVGCFRRPGDGYCGGSSEPRPP